MKPYRIRWEMLWREWRVEMLRRVSTGEWISVAEFATQREAAA